MSSGVVLILFNLVVLGGCCPSMGWLCGVTACYNIYECYKPFSEARNICEEDGYTLASVASAEERQFLVDFIDTLLPTDNLFWVGGNRKSQSDEFTWLDGSPFLFTGEATTSMGLCLVYRGRADDDFIGNGCDQWHQFICRNGSGVHQQAVVEASIVECTETSHATSVVEAVYTRFEYTSSSSLSSSSSSPSDSDVTTHALYLPLLSPSVTGASPSSKNPSSGTLEFVSSTNPLFTLSPLTMFHSTSQDNNHIIFPSFSESKQGFQASAEGNTIFVFTDISISTTTTKQVQNTISDDGSYVSETVLFTTGFGDSALRDVSPATDTSTQQSTDTQSPHLAVSASSGDAYIFNKDINPSPSFGYSDSGINSRHEFISNINFISSESERPAPYWFIRDTNTFSHVPSVRIRTPWNNEAPSLIKLNSENTSPAADALYTYYTNSPTHLLDSPTGQVTVPFSSVTQETDHRLSNQSVVCGCCYAWHSRNNSSVDGFSVGDLVVIKRKKLQTADDTRPSARGIGGSAIALLVAGFFAVVVMDASKLMKDLHRMYRNLRWMLLQTNPPCSPNHQSP